MSAISIDLIADRSRNLHRFDCVEKTRTEIHFFVSRSRGRRPNIGQTEERDMNLVRKRGE
jgi:hypothetical protein